MEKALEAAIAEAATLPDRDQEESGRKLLSPVEMPRQLRPELDTAIGSPDGSKGEERDVEQLRAEARSPRAVASGAVLRSAATAPPASPGRIDEEGGISKPDRQGKREAPVPERD